MPRFRNRYPAADHGGGNALKWMFEFAFEKWQPVEFPLAQNRPAWLAANRSEPSLTWIGHASFLLQLDGLNVLTDPVFGARASPFTFAGPRRLTPVGLAINQLPPIDLVLISHNHYDHLDDASVRRLAQDHPQAQFVVPLGLKVWFAERGITRVVELEWWQSATLGAARVTSVPVQHFSGRSLRDRNATQWCGLVLELGGRRVLFAGDTGYSKDFADIGARFAPFDLALLPIGAYDPRWFMAAVHVNPEEAVQIHLDIDSRLSVAMHWGTFRLTSEPLDEPPQRLAAALRAAGVSEQSFVVYQHGETRVLNFAADQPAQKKATA